MIEGCWRNELLESGMGQPMVKDDGDVLVRLNWTIHREGEHDVCPLRTAGTGQSYHGRG